MKYDAFISYSHAADGQLAPSLQKALHRIARPFLKIRALNVFRDKTSLSATPDLWSKIEEGLASSKYLILLASPIASQSIWVGKEVSYWLNNKSINTLLIGVTDGNIYWDAKIGDFDWTKTDCIPSQLQGKFLKEPLYVDFRSEGTKEDVSYSNPNFVRKAAELAATIHQIPFNDLIGEDVRLKKNTNRIVLAVFFILLVLSSSLAFFFSESKVNENLATSRGDSLLVQLEVQKSLTQELKEAIKEANDNAERAERNMEYAKTKEEEAVSLANSEKASRERAEYNYANSLSAKAQRLLGEMRFTAASVLLNSAKNTYLSTEVLATSLQTPMSHFMPIESGYLPKSTTKRTYLNDIGNLLLSQDVGIRVVAKAAGADAIVVDEELYLTEKTIGFNPVSNSAWIVKRSGEVMEVDTLGNVFKRGFVPMDGANYDQIKFFQWLPNNKSILLVNQNGEIYLFDEIDGARKLEIESQENFIIDDAALLFGKNKLAISNLGGEIYFYDLSTWRKTDSIKVVDYFGGDVPENHISIKFSSESNYMVAWGSEEARVFKTNDLKNVSSISANLIEEDSRYFDSELVCFTESEEKVLFPSNDKLKIISTEDGTVIKEISNGSQLDYFALAENERFIVLAEADGGIGVYNLNSGDLIEKLEGNSTSIVGLSTNFDGAVLYVTFADGFVRSYQFIGFPDLYFEPTFSSLFVDRSMCFSNRGDVIAIPFLSNLESVQNKHIVIVDAKSGYAEKIINVDKEQSLGVDEQISRLYFSFDDEWLIAVTSSGKIASWNLKGSIDCRVPWQELSGLGINMIDSGRGANNIFGNSRKENEMKILKISCGVLQVIGSANVEMSNVLLAHPRVVRSEQSLPVSLLKELDNVYFYNFTQNTGVLTFVTSEFIIHWNLNSGKYQKLPLEKNIAYRSSKYDFSNDGNLLVVISNDGARKGLDLYDLRTGEYYYLQNPRARMYGANIGLFDVSFGEEEVDVFTISWNGLVQRWGMGVPLDKRVVEKLTGLQAEGSDVKILLTK